MRPRFSFSCRRTGNIAKMRKQREKYPTLAQKIVETTDILLEVLDARFIKDTRNLDLEKEIRRRKKKLIYIINKADLVDPKKIKEDINSINALTEYEEERIYPFVLISALEKRGSKELRDKIKQVGKSIEKIETKIILGGRIKEGDKNEPQKIKIGVIGYPNTGKSSVINFLIGKRGAGTGSDAGFTKGLQKLKLTEELTLIDTPGVIPDKEYSGIEKEAIAKHTKVGARSFSQVKEPEMVIANLMKDFPSLLEDYYNIDAKGDSEILIEELGRKKGFMKKGEEVNFDTTSRFILKEWQKGKIKIE